MKHYCHIEKMNEADNGTLDLISEAEDGVECFIENMDP